MAWPMCSFFFNGAATSEKIGTNRWSTLQRPKKYLSYVCFLGSLSLRTTAAVALDSFGCLEV